MLTYYLLQPTGERYELPRLGLNPSDARTIGIGGTSQRAPGNPMAFETGDGEFEPTIITISFIVAGANVWAREEEIRRIAAKAVTATSVIRERTTEPLDVTTGGWIAGSNGRPVDLSIGHAWAVLNLLHADARPMPAGRADRMTLSFRTLFGMPTDSVAEYNPAYEGAHKVI